MAKNQLHQLLAVESDLVNKAAQIANETSATFRSKGSHFDGSLREYIPFEEPENDLMKMHPEVTEIVTTVQAKLDYNSKAMIRAIDAKLSKEATNSRGGAVAPLEFGDESWTMSATELLALEGFLNKIRDVYKGIPTLDPTKQWESASAPGVYIAPPRDTFKTEKVAKAIVKFPATKEHPAQTEMVTLDQNVGINRVVATSGRFTSQEKSDMLERIDYLLVTVKKARAAANRADVMQVKVGKTIFDYIHGDGYDDDDYLEDGDGIEIKI
jgi:hypothetical protein